MIHGISDHEWMAYLDGELEAKERERLESHFIGCAICWEFFDRLARTTARLDAAGKATRHSVPLRDDELQRSMGEVLARIRGKTGTPGRLQPTDVRERLDCLERVMAPMCGTTTATRALRAAAQGSPAQSLEYVTADNWTPFLSSLTSIAAVMCGETGAHLVWESGQL